MAQLASLGGACISLVGGFGKSVGLTPEPLWIPAPDRSPGHAFDRRNDGVAVKVPASGTPTKLIQTHALRATLTTG